MAETKDAKEDAGGAQSEEKDDEVVDALIKIPGIERAGAERLGQMLADGGFSDLESLRGASKEDLQSVKGIGPSTAEKIIDGLKEIEVVEKDEKGGGAGDAGEKHGSIVDDIFKLTKGVVGKTKGVVEGVVKKVAPPKKAVDADKAAPKPVTIEAEEDEDAAGKEKTEGDDEAERLKAEGEEARKKAVEEFLTVDGVKKKDAERLCDMGYTGLKDLIDRTLEK